MADGAAGRISERGSILLPVIVVLLLIASAATAMTLQVRASLREASTRRDRITLAMLADGLVRSTALALAQAVSSKASPPFSIDGTPQGCVAGGHRFVLTVQDEGGLVDLNKGTSDLLLRVLTSAGVSGWDAKEMVAAIAARRDPNTAKPSGRPGSRRQGATPAAAREGYGSADELDGLPGMTDALFDRLRPIFSVDNGAAGLDPAVASPALRRLIPRKEMTAPAFEPMTAPSSHSSFTITATAISRTGMRFQRQAAFRLDPNTGPTGRFLGWNAPVSLGDLPADEPSPFCERWGRALTAT